MSGWHPLSPQAKSLFILQDSFSIFYISSLIYHQRTTTTTTTTAVTTPTPTTTTTNSSWALEKTQIWFKFESGADFFLFQIFFLDSFPQNLTNLSTKYQQERSKKNIVMPVLMQKSENFVENKTIQTRTFGLMRNVGLFLFLLAKQYFCNVGD